MATRIIAEIRISAQDETRQTEIADERVVFSAGSLLKREVVSLTGSAFTALSPPSGAKAVVIFCGSTASLTLKGITGDGGITTTPSSPIGLPLVMPLGSSPGIGFLNSGSTATVEVWWL